MQNVVVILILVVVLIALVVWRRRTTTRLLTNTENLPAPKDMFFFVQLALESVCGRINDLGLHSLTGPEKTFYWAWTLEAYVHIGGFRQFLVSYAQHAVEAAEALNKIGAARYADITRRANALVPQGCLPDDPALRKRHLKALTRPVKDQLKSLDNEFYNCGEDTTPLLHAFVVQHRTEFPGLHRD
ncbi:MAG: DMP19 family protein [Planctomycetota bacterium]|jgi:hypothetical protein